MALVLVVVLGVLVAGAAVWRHRRESARREALFTFAVSRGWTYTVADNALASHWVGTPFGHGDDRRVTNVLRGTSGEHSLIAFDYQFKVDSDTTSGSNSIQRYSVVVLGMPAYLPTLEVTPESVLDRMGSAVGIVRDLELESEDFNRKYRVSAYDPKFATDVLTPRTMDLLNDRPSLAFRIQGTDLVSWGSGILDPLEIVERASTLTAVLAGVPTYVWRDHGATA